MNSRKLAAVALGALLLIPSGLWAGDREAQQPFKIKGTIIMTAVDVVNSPGFYNFVDTGQGTYLGNYVNIGWMQFIPNPADPTGAPLILSGAGVAYAANGDPSDWVMEPLTGRVLITGTSTFGRFSGANGFFDSTITSLVMSPEMESGVCTYTGEGEITFAH